MRVCPRASADLGASDAGRAGAHGSRGIAWDLRHVRAPPERDLRGAVREVAQRVKPAVVQITSERVQFDLFNRPFTVPGGVGSGVIYDNQGHIPTNNHVVEGAQRLLASLPDGRSFQASLVTSTNDLLNCSANRRKSLT